jgi:hypothetical protein
MAAVAISTDQIGGLAVAVIIAIVLVGFLLGLFINAALARIVVALVVVALAILVWTQRTSLQNRVKNCDTNLSFFGVHTTLSSSAEAHCAALHR